MTKKPMTPYEQRRFQEQQVESNALEAMRRANRIDSAPIGTKAPAILGGWWGKVENGWKWNGPDGNGGTFPRPGGDWDGRLLMPAPLNPILDGIPFRSCDTVMVHRYEPTGLPEIRWRPATPEEIAISGAAHAVTTAGQRGPEQGRFGYFRGMIIIIHPDMPPHVWDGKTMTRIEPQEG